MLKLCPIINFALPILLIIFGCQSKVAENSFAAFDHEFFAFYLPEFPGARLLTKEDLPPDQRIFFDEAKAQLQLLQDMNNDSVLDFVFCGVSDSLLKSGKSPAYFIAIFQKTNARYKKEYLQPLRIIPVNLSPGTDRPGVIISFAFSSDFVAEIYYENKAYHLQRWY